MARIALAALAAAFLSLPARATTLTVGTHADPSADAAAPVVSLLFSGMAIVDAVPVYSALTLSGAYTEDDAAGTPHAPLQLISGVSFDDWDFVFEPTLYTPLHYLAGFIVYGSGAGSFAYYLAGSDHNDPSNLILGASFDKSLLTLPASGVGSMDAVGGAVVELVYGPASGLSSATLADPEQFGFSFANYVGGTGTLAGPSFASATASFTSSATVELAEPSGAALGALVLAGLAARRRRTR